MNKVSSYLQGHLTGQVTTRKDRRELYAKSAGVLMQIPEMIIAPYSVNDVRKVNRFAWQLAEKGHKLTLTARGNGTDRTSSNLAKGALLLMQEHMYNIYEYDTKQQLIRAQAGASAEAVSAVLRLSGAAIPPILDHPKSTFGGLIASDDSSRLSGKYGSLKKYVRNLEVVLDTGDVLQTGPITKRELNRLVGTQGRIGDIYRGVDRILEDYADLISDYRHNSKHDRSGYAGIIDVRQKNGSIDLTPLFIGSQGSLGIIVEAIVKAEYLAISPAMAIMAFDDIDAAREVGDQILKTKPSVLEYLDGRLLETAIAEGKNYEWLGDNASHAKALVFVSYDDFSDRVKKRALKKISKLASKFQAKLVTSDDEEVEKLNSIHQITDYVLSSTTRNDQAGVLAVPSFYLPTESFGAMEIELMKLEKSLKVQLPLRGSLINSTYSLYAPFSMTKVTDKQKLLKLLEQFALILDKLNGNLIAAGGEGRLLSRYARMNWTEDYAKMMDEVKQLFDPHGILNPLVKTTVELKELASEMRSDNQPQR